MDRDVPKFFILGSFIPQGLNQSLETGLFLENGLGITILYLYPTIETRYKYKYTNVFKCELEINFFLLKFVFVLGLKMDTNPMLPNMTSNWQQM